MRRFGPEGLVLRTRWLFLLLNLLVAATTLLALPGSGGSGINYAFSTLALVAIMAWSVHRYRFPKACAVFDVVPIGAIVLLGINAASPDAAFGPTFALVCYRAQFGNNNEVIGNAGAYFGAFLLPYLLLGDGMEPRDIVSSVLLLGFLLVVAKVMHGFVVSARRQEAALARERLLADGSAALLAAGSEVEVNRAALRTLTGLSSGRAQVCCLRMDGTGGVEQPALDDQPGSREARAWLVDLPEVLHLELRAGKVVYAAPPRPLKELARSPRRARARPQMAALPVLLADELVAVAVITAENRPDLDEVAAPVSRFVDEVRLAVEGVRLHDELRRVSASKDLFLSMVSHELRTPLTVVRGAFEALQARGDSMSRDVRAELLELGVRQSLRQQRLIDDLLLTTRLLAGRSPVAPEQVDLAVVLGEVVRELELTEQVVMDVEAGTSWSAWVDPLHAAQIVTNLLTNARKYGAPPIEVTARWRDADILLNVRDHGPGISPDDAVRIFDPFEQGPPGQQPTAGVGLGLAIARRLALANRGDLGLHPVPGPGACFELRLPIGVTHP